VLLAAYEAAGLGRWACFTLVALAAVKWAATSSLGHARYPGFTPKPDIRSAARFILAQATREDAVVSRMSSLDSLVFDHYTRGHDLRRAETTDEAAWLIIPAGATAVAPVEVAER